MKILRQNQLVDVAKVFHFKGFSMKNLEYSFNNLKIRSCIKKNEFENFDTLEIVETNNEVLAYWEKDNNLHDIKFMGSKHLDYENQSFWKLLEFGNEILKRRKNEPKS